MSFSVDLVRNEIFPVVYLKDETTKSKIEIYSFGALLNAFIVDGRQNIIDGFSSYNDAKANIADNFRSCKLSPFVCRIPKGEYSFQNKKYKTGKVFLGEEAIHGLLFDVDFSIKDYDANKDNATVELELIYDRTDEGFPFAYSCNVKYTLEKNNRLSILTTIKNISGSEMPLSDGWHPYFNFGKPINDLKFSINSDKMIEFNDLLVPTGKMLPYNKFQKAELIHETFLDNSFQLNNTTQPSCVLEDEEQKLRLKIIPDRSYPYLQIFTPETRERIAIENLSSAPNAFNNKMGLIILQPNESKIFKTTYEAEYF